MKSGLLRGVYSVKGKNVDYIIEFLHRKGVSIYSFKKINENHAEICIDFKQRNKLFAICSNLSYNITKVYYKGLLSPFKTAFQHVGQVLGALAFIAVCFFMQDFIFSVEVKGSGACFENQTKSIASSLSAKPFSRFSSLNFNEIESSILKQNKMLSFVSLKKSGNRLVIETHLNSGYSEPFNSVFKDVVSEYNGVIESVVVLRGTKLKSAGDEVKKGETIVKAFITDSNGVEYPTYVVARISILEEQVFTFKVPNVSSEQVLLAKKTAEFNANGEVLKCSAKVSANKITVTVLVRHIIST